MEYNDIFKQGVSTLIIKETKLTVNPYKQDLVMLSTQDITKAVVITDSLTIAKEFDKQHKNVLRDILDLKNSLLKIEPSETAQYLLHETPYTNTRGKQYTKYEMNEPFFMLLVMGFTGEKALRLKNDFIKAFYGMQHELLIRSNTRHIGIVDARKPLTEAISVNVTESPRKKFSYSNYTKLIYKTILGTTVKKYIEENGLPEKAHIRDYFNSETLAKIRIAEIKVASIIEFMGDANDKEVYNRVKDYMVQYGKELKE